MKKRLFAFVMAVLFSVSMVGLPFAQAAEVTEPEKPAIDVPTVKITVTANWYQNDGKTAYTGERPAVSYELYLGDIEKGEKPIKTYNLEAGKDTLEFTLVDTDTTYTLKEVFTTESDCFVEAANQSIDPKLGQGLTPVFNHTYVEPIKSEPATLNLTAEVTYAGAAPANNAYSVVLTDKNTGSAVQTKKNTGKTVTFDTLSYDTEGTYNYTMTEQAGSSTNINYDDSVYEIVVTVTKGSDGNLQATTTMTKDGASYSGVPSFANTKKSSTTTTTTTTTSSKISVSVTKVWKNDKESTRPSSVSVQLYRNGSVYGSSVKLSDSNSWKHTWSNLDSSYTWTVNETAVPSGYTRSVTNSGNSWTITNTSKTGTTSTTSDTSTPSTGDERGTKNMMMVSVLLFGALLCLGAAYFTRKKANK